MNTKISIIALLVSLLVLSPAGFALDLQQAKNQGLVCEKVNGYLGYRKGSASAEVKALVGDINAKRKMKYAQISAKQGVSLDVVEKLAGQKAQNKTKPGHFIQTADGKWKKR
ncbi:MAG: YdbL family protein [Cellvibrionaceae bacterium]|nr:YdbL family protein [Cellvibrionaceae bacterium]